MRHEGVDARRGARYVDDGISGTEFAKRCGLVRLINAADAAPPFQVLVISEESRLGREQIETAYLLKQLITAGVRIFYYLEDRERTLNSPTEKLLLSVPTFADEMERVKARARTRDAMVRKARAGHVAAGRSTCPTLRNERRGLGPPRRQLAWVNTRGRQPMGDGDGRLA